MYFIFFILLFILFFYSINSNKFFKTSNIYCRLIGFLQGYQIKFLQNEEFYAISKKSAQKGYMVEHLIAKPRWKPLLSIESEDGNNWKKLHKLCLKTLSNISISQAKQVTNKYCQQYLRRYEIITSEEISKLTLSIFFELVFCKQIDTHTLIIFYRASIEWKKCIAMKGVKDKTIVNQFMKILEKLLNTTDIYQISAIAQPFIISPQINVADIMVTWKKYPEKSLEEILSKAHPFPILERFLDGVQYLHWMYPLEHNKVNWGAGNRKCLGMSLVKPILKRMIYHFTNNYDKIHPEVLHQYSGRNNDNNLNPIELYYQITGFIKILFNLLFLN